MDRKNKIWKSRGNLRLEETQLGVSSTLEGQKRHCITLKGTYGTRQTLFQNFLRGLAIGNLKFRTPKT